MRLETLAVHAGRRTDPITGSVAAPLYLSSTFERGETGDPFFYARLDHPNRRMLERCMQDLEAGCGAAAFASGIAAACAAIEASCAGTGSRVLLPDRIYYGNRALLDQIGFTAYECQSTQMSDLDALRRTCEDFQPAMVWIETPSNPTLAITDIAAVCAIARDCGARAIVDNTFATPVLQRPFELGADVIVHSLTKYVGGHSDLMAGAVVVRDDEALLERVRDIQRNKGAVTSPFDCWLALRGVQTLPQRMAAHCANAARVAAFLQQSDSVLAVHYPGLESDPGHAVAKRQMGGFGGMLAFRMRAGRDAAARVCASVQLIAPATSLGGTHSLIEHRASAPGESGLVPDDLLRLSVGLEHPDDLIEDLVAAFARS